MERDYVYWNEEITYLNLEVFILKLNIMPTYSSFVFSDKEKNDIKKLHESYRMSYGRLIKEQPSDSAGDAPTEQSKEQPSDSAGDAPTEQEQRPLTGPESLTTDLMSGPITAQVSVRLGKLYITPKTGNKDRDRISYVGKI